jgi:hypothetical protein
MSNPALLDRRMTTARFNRRLRMIRLRPTFVTLLVAASAVLAAAFAPSHAEAAGPAKGISAGITPVKTGFVAANGVNYHYRIYGRGEPLLLLHGGLGPIETFGPVLDTLATMSPGWRCR